MSNIEKRKSEGELIEIFNNKIHEAYKGEREITVGSFLAYTTFGCYIYKVSSVEETEYGVRLILLPLNGGSDKSVPPDQIQYYKHLSDNFDLEAFNEDVDQLLKGDLTIVELSERLESTKQSETNELMRLGMDSLLSKKDHLTDVNSYLQLASKRAEALLQAKLSGLNEIVSGFKKTISKINKLIYTIELYQGLTEEIHHIKVGVNSPSSEPIHIRQRKLYMDEEVGDPTDKGLDFKNIEDFDNWLVQKNTYWGCYNYDFIVPESKCIVALGIRRGEKNYSDNPFINGMLNDNNKWTYLLIRNGDNLYRIYSDLRIGEKMFPEQTEMGELQAKFEESRFESDREQIDSEMDRYKYNMILIQGVIERTDAFGDDRYTVNILRDLNPEKVKLVYDNEKSKLIGSSEKPFWKWIGEKNQGTEEGSQIIWFTNSITDKTTFRYERESFNDRMFNEYHYYQEQYPNRPTDGLYQLERTTKEGKNYIFFKYDPRRDSYHYWNEDKKRIKRVSFEFKIDEDIFINYDNIKRDDLKTLNDYFHSRENRKNYLRYIPFIVDIMKRKESEFEKENDFIKLALQQAGLNPEDSFAFQNGVAVMDWWKTKNKWKRTLSTDDAKALRMIVKELKK